MEAVLRKTSIPLHEPGLTAGQHMLLDALDFQRQAVAQALDATRLRLLIADAVGLGKALEIGMILSELPAAPCRPGPRRDAAARARVDAVRAPRGRPWCGWTSTGSSGSASSSPSAALLGGAAGEHRDRRGRHAPWRSGMTSTTANASFVCHSATDVGQVRLHELSWLLPLVHVRLLVVLGSRYRQHYGSAGYIVAACVVRPLPCYRSCGRARRPACWRCCC